MSCYHSSVYLCPSFPCAGLSSHIPAFNFAILIQHSATSAHPSLVLSVPGLHQEHSRPRLTYSFITDSFTPTHLGGNGGKSMRWNMWNYEHYVWGNLCVIRTIKRNRLQWRDKKILPPPWNTRHRAGLCIYFTDNKGSWQRNYRNTKYWRQIREVKVKIIKKDNTYNTGNRKR